MENAIRLARQRKIEVDQTIAVAQEQKAAALEQERLNEALDDSTQRIKQVVDRFDSLLAEQRYAVADEQIVPEIQRLAPSTPIESSLVYGGRFHRAVARERASLAASRRTTSFGRCSPSSCRWCRFRMSRRSFICPPISGKT